MRLPNFSWRRKAILYHDLHHILTGYPCTMRGEFQIATWEFAAGRFRHPASTLFCLPLVALGCAWSLRAIWSAFLKGRRTATLYDAGPIDDILQQPFAALRLRQEIGASANPKTADIASFIGLVAASAFLICAPVLGLSAIAALLL